MAGSSVFTSVVFPGKQFIGHRESLVGLHQYKNHLHPVRLSILAEAFFRSSSSFSLAKLSVVTSKNRTLSLPPSIPMVSSDTSAQIDRNFVEQSSLTWIPIGKLAGDFHANSIRRLLLSSQGIGRFTLWYSAFMSRGL